MRSFFTSLLASLAVCSGLHAQTDSLISIFKDPPQSARPQVWWHWMDGNVSKEGIRKDLEWMKRSGIGGFHQFDAGGIDMPRAAKVKLPYLSEGWKDAFRFALSLADSLGLEAAIASAPGWSSTGGTWVAPEDAVKKIEWKSVDVDGGRVDVRLPDLFRVVGPYQDFFQDNDRVRIEPYGRDLYVIAVKRPKADLNMEEMGSQTTLTDSLITVRFPRPMTIKAFTLKSMAMGGRPRTGEPDCRNILECGDDGLHWREVHRILPSRVPYMTEDITPVTARYFRVRGEKLAGLELFTVSKVNHPEELGGFSNNFDFNRFHIPETEDGIASVIDLTGKMTSDGRLRCRLPKGRWRIYRFGWSITGKINHPASPEATGLEVDKLDEDAWMRYFRHYLDLYKEAAGGMLGKKGIRYLLTDSYEAGSYTWTSNLPEEFERRRGYSLIPWLPVLAGEIVSDSRSSEGFLWDWRRTLGELFCENYARISDLVKEYDLDGSYCETHEGGRAYVGDGMDPKITSTIPMAAIWMENTPTGSRPPTAIADIRESASAAHLYGKRVVAAESFSVNGDEGRAYTYCPENMKYIADVALSAGLNRFVIHESASQPGEEYLPGLQLFRYGQWLHRNETWGEYAYVFTDYLARSGAMLQEGRPVADILLYYGEDSNVCSQYGGDTFDLLPQVPSGYEYDFANPNTLLHGVNVSHDDVLARGGVGGTTVYPARTQSAGSQEYSRNGADSAPSFPELESVGGMRYKVLWLDRNCETMSLEILRRIKEFADAGVRICGKAPVRCAGLLADQETFDALVADIWRSGRPNVYSDLADALGGIDPDCQADFGDGIASPEAFRYVHRSLQDGSHIYWVRNFSGADVTASIHFREGGTHAALLNPEDGGIYGIPVQRESEGVTVPLPMLSTDAFIIVFSDHPIASDLPGVPERADGILVKLIDTPWEVSFAQKGGRSAMEIFPGLHSWTECGNPVVKYFSGTATYRTTFTLEQAELEKAGEISLDLGAVKNIAEVSVNGIPVGVLWKAPFRTEGIRSLLRAGENTLEIKVTNLWRNRMIGDVQTGEEHPVTAIRRFYKAEDSLLPSGLLGPVSLRGL